MKLHRANLPFARVRRPSRQHQAPERLPAPALALAGAAAATAFMLTAAPAAAGEVYTGIGLPGVGLGFAQPLNPSWTLRADVFTLGERDRDRTESGIFYNGHYKLHRAALLADWFPMQGSFRLTGGATFNRYKGVLDATGASGFITIGGRTYVTTAADGLRVDIDYPKTTPYLGLGWGHQMGTGWRFVADVGASIGRAKLRATPRGQLANQPDIQANIDSELAELLDDVGKVKAIPQLSVGFGYSF